MRLLDPAKTVNCSKWTQEIKKIEIVGLSTANDEHLFMMINNNPNIRSVVYYYLKDDDKIELPHHIKKPITFKKVTKLWYSMK